MTLLVKFLWLFFLICIQKVQNNLESGQIVVVNGEVQFSRQKEIVVNKINLAQTILNK